MITKFKIGDVFNLSVDIEIRFENECRSVDIDELKVAIELFINNWIRDDEICPVLEEVNYASFD